jgi:aspartate kinase
MIVMKFGGSSLASTSSFRQVVSIVRSELHRDPVVVASAMGDTTDLLVQLLAEARKANSYMAWKLLEAIKDQHYSVSSDLLSSDQREPIDDYLRLTFRDLHVRMQELCEGERLFTPELQDWTLSLGEQISSRLLAAVLTEHCCATTHVDARRLILTDNTFTSAQPRYWETYARIRWAIPPTAQRKVTVLGGFIGSTDQGQTTTLGRGGSDLTASIVGAALNAEEIQVWKDVNGMLTWDPRLLPGAHNVSSLSYDEADELAHAGATILHPETVEPAKRLRIPIVIRNTFRPEGPGTRISFKCEDATNTLKSIAVKKAVTLLEVSVANPSDNCDDLIAYCQRHSSASTVIHASEKAAYVAIDENAMVPDEQLTKSTCIAAKVRSRQALVTLVGRFSSDIVTRVRAALPRMPLVIVPSDAPSLSLRIVIPQHDLEQCLKRLNREFFATADSQAVVNALEMEPKPVPDVDSRPARVGSAPERFVLSTAMMQPN